MKCAQHNDHDAVGQCQDCGRGLCPECLDKYGYPCCDNCAAEYIKEHRSHWIKQAVMSIPGFIFGFIILIGPGQANIGIAILGGFLFAGIPWGWGALSRITPNIFLWMSLPGWVVYFMIKIWLSTIIGIFIMPYKIYRIVTELRAAKVAESYTGS